MHSTCSPCDSSCPAYLQGGLTPNTVPNFMPRPNAEHLDQLLLTDLPYFKAMAKDLNIQLAKVRTSLKESEIENARLRHAVNDLHAKLEMVLDLPGMDKVLPEGHITFPDGDTWLAK